MFATILRWDMDTVPPTWTPMGRHTEQNAEQPLEFLPLAPRGAWAPVAQRQLVSVKALEPTQVTRAPEAPESDPGEEGSVNG